jgi:hypothetical protein
MTAKSWISPKYAQIFATKLPNFQPDVESLPSPAPVKGWDAISPLAICRRIMQLY